MSLIEKALKKSELFGNGESAQPYHSPTLKQNNLSTKKSVGVKTILLISLVLSLLFLLCASLILYQKSNGYLKTEESEKGEHSADSSIMPDVDTVITSKPKAAANVLPSDTKGKEITEKDTTKDSTEKGSSTFLDEKKESPVLVKIENDIRSHQPKPIKKKESKSSIKEQLLNNHYNNAIKLEKAGKLREAVLEYERSLVLNPRHIKSYNNLGGIYYKLGNFNLAVESYKNALTINPNYIKVHNNLGILLFRLDKVDEAIDEFKLAISLDPKNTESYNNLGITYKSIGEIEKARKTFKSALAADPDNAEVHYNLAILYESDDDLELAFSHYQKFIEFSPPHHHELVKKVREHLFHLAGKSALRETKGKPDSKKK